jgi:hypothetical protein
MRIKIAIIIFILLFNRNAYSFDNVLTHKDITKNAAENSNLSSYLISSIGFKKGIETKLNGKTILQWVREGSSSEDEPMCRATNHFHNPLLSWDKSYMTDEPSLIDVACVTWRRHSNVTWATGYLSPPPDGNKETFVTREPFAPYNLDKAREYYYKALTDNSPNYQEIYFSNTFRFLGHVIHLLQDMGVPAHTRNDFQSHLFKNDQGIANLYGFFDRYQPFEKYVEINPWLVSVANPAGNFPSFTNTRLTYFWDTDQYTGRNPSTETDIGLAEFSNANYYSDYTILSNKPTSEHNFPHPAINSSEHQICTDYQHNSLEKRKYISRKIKGDCPPLSTERKADHFAVASLMNVDSSITNDNISSLRLWLDNNVHNTYGKDILPRAVGYSAGLLNYFFRGDINLKYESGANPGYVIANNSNENMSGTFRIFYDNLYDERIELWKGTLALNALSKSARIDFPIPANAKEPGKYILVFRGTLGNEKDAVAGRVAGRFLEITPPDQFVYSMIDGSKNPKLFTEIKAKLKNGNPAEALQNGVIQAIVKFKQGKGAQDFSYLTSVPIPIDSLSAGSPREFPFNFYQNPIPIDITDLYLQVIFTGRIGDENNAVAIGMKDISEPTPIDVFNNMDRVCINGSWYVAGSPEAIARVDKDHDGIGEEWDVYPHDLTDVYLKIAPVNDFVDASPDDFMFYASEIKAGQMYRAYVLSEYQLNHSGYVTAVPIVQDDKTNWDHTQAIMKKKWSGYAVKDQEEYHVEQEVCAQYDFEAPCIVQHLPEYYTFRGKQMWGAAGIIFDNPKYPPDADCSWEDLQ